MNNLTKVLAISVAGLVISTGAYAQEATETSASNLGTAVVGTNQAGTAWLAGMGGAGLAIASVAILGIGFAIASDHSDRDIGVADPLPPPPPPFPHAQPHLF